MKTAVLVIAAVFGLIVFTYSPKDIYEDGPGYSTPSRTETYDYSELDTYTPSEQRRQDIFGIEEAKRFTKASEFYDANWYTTPDEPMKFKKSIDASWDEDSIHMLVNQHLYFTYDRNEPGTDTTVHVTDTLGHEPFSYVTDTDDLLTTLNAFHLAQDISGNNARIQGYYSKDIEMDVGTEQLPAPEFDQILAVPPP